MIINANLDDLDRRIRRVLKKERDPEIRWYLRELLKDQERPARKRPTKKRPREHKAIAH